VVPDKPEHYASDMSESGAKVPPEIEDYLIGVAVSAGQIGGAIGGAAGSRGGARGGARGASHLKTKIEQRSGDVPGSSEQVTARLTRAFPKAKPLPAGDHVRLAVPVGLTGLQQIIVDAEFSPVDGTRVHVALRGFGKEGLISRKPTRTVTDQAWAAITSSSG
jgi:hypothetical protein